MMENGVLLMRVEVYLSLDYFVSEAIYIPINYSKDEITAAVNAQYGSDWYYYDII